MPVPKALSPNAEHLCARSRHGVALTVHALLAAATICVSVAALGWLGGVPTSVKDQASVGDSAGAVLIGVGLILATIAAVLAFVDRSLRDISQVRAVWWSSALAAFLSLGLAGIGILWSVVNPSVRVGPLDVASALPAILTAVLVGIAAWRYPRPVQGHRSDRILVIVDTLAGCVGCVLLAYGLLTSVLGSSLNSPATGSWVMVRVWADVAVVAFVIFISARSRLPGCFAFRQLALVVAAGLLFASLDIASVAVGQASPQLAPLPLLLGAQVAVAWLVAAAALRPALENETRWEVRARQGLAVIVPLLPVALAVIAIVWAGVQRDQAGFVAAVIATLLMAALVVAVLVWRRAIWRGNENAEQAVARSDFEETTDKTWFRTMAGETSDVVTVIDLRGTVVYQTPSVSRILGFEPGYWRDKPFSDLVHLDDHSKLQLAMSSATREKGRSRSVELTLRARDGSWRDTETSVTALPGDDGLPGFVITTRDVSDRRRMRETLERQAETDELTGLPNRSALRRHATESLRGVTSAHIAALALDIDGFRALNDTLGHGFGDDILRQVAGALRRCVRPWDVVARVGGDEFAVLIVGANAERSVNRVQERMRRSLAAVVVGDGREIRLAVSAGYAVNDLGTETADELLRNADLALARARSARRVEVLRFEAPMHEALVIRVKAEQELLAALAARELELAYQPVVRLHDAKIIGAEALIRWRHPTRGLVAAGEFVPLAEEMGIVHELGVWALRKACRDLAALRLRNPTLDQFPVSVNVSGHQIEPDLVEEVGSATADAGITPADLILEVTESVLARRPDEAAKVLQSLRALGACVALDDFGTGYSSLAYLAEFPVDILKIDRTFVADVGTSSQRLALTRTIVSLGQALQLTIVAEGVETAEQADLLRGMGCEHAQGYVFSRPVPLSALELLLQGSSGRLTSRPESGALALSDRVVVLPDTSGRRVGSL